MKTLTFIAILGISASVQAQSLPATYPSHYFSFTPTDSVSFPPIYPDWQKRDSIGALYSNSYKRAQAIEAYALDKQDINFLKRSDEDSTQWIVTLIGGKTVKVGPLRHSSAEDYNYEYYYRDKELIVFRAQWYEGNNYVVVSRKDGSKTEMFGPPVFAPSVNFFISINGTGVSDYSNNGIQLFEITAKGIKKLIEYHTQPSPSAVKWIDPNTFILQIYKATPVEFKGILKTYRHYRVNIIPAEN